MNRKTLAAIAAFLVALGTLLGVLTGNDTASGPESVKLDGPGHQTVTLPDGQAPAEVVENLDEKVADQNERDDVKDSLPVAEDNLPTIKRQTTGNDVVLPVQTLADFTQEGCATRPVRNFSSRRGYRPGLIVLHYTVSANRPGSGDVASIVVYFDDARSQASSNYVIDNEGNCAYIVSELNKAWTQGNMNFASACSFEVINTGHEPTYIGPGDGPGMAKIARVVHDCAHRWGIPIRQGATSGCDVIRTGVVDHDELACDNFHTDINPFHAAIAQIVAAAAALDVPACDARCKRVKELRGKHGRTHARFRKNECNHRGIVKHGAYCERLRHRNKAVHIAAKREGISLTGTFR